MPPWGTWGAHTIPENGALDLKTKGDKAMNLRQEMIRAMRLTKSLEACQKKRGDLQDTLTALEASIPGLEAAVAEGIEIAERRKMAAIHATAVEHFGEYRQALTALEAAADGMMRDLTEHRDLIREGGTFALAWRRRRKLTGQDVSGRAPSIDLAPDEVWPIENCPVADLGENFRFGELRKVRLVRELQKA